jgi:hypothetical protein
MKRLLVILSCIFLTVQISVAGAKGQVADLPRIQCSDSLKSLYPAMDTALIRKGVDACAQMWVRDSLPEVEWLPFCIASFMGNDKDKEQLMMRSADHLNAQSKARKDCLDRTSEFYKRHYGNVMRVDSLFDDCVTNPDMVKTYYKNRIPYMLALNFPRFTLKEMNAYGAEWSSKEWAYARMADMIPSNPGDKPMFSEEWQRKGSGKLKPTDEYVADYNLYMGHVLYEDGRRLFPKDMVLLCHWNLRDELKADYAEAPNHFEKQKTIKKAMDRIISQEIPVEVINSAEYDWNPFTNKLYLNGKLVEGHPEDTVRYAQLGKHFDPDYKYGDSKIPIIDQTFDGQLEMPVDEVESMFRTLLSAPERKAVAGIIRKRLGRPLEPFDIWYDGFKTRSALNQDSLDLVIKAKYPNSEAVQKDLFRWLCEVGFTPEEAMRISTRIEVDPDPGSGHAMGPLYKGDKARLRTRFVNGVLDYKGYNIATHEFGHNVEQVISLYDVPYLALNGIPNTAFTEALAFIFQAKDLEFLGIRNNAPDRESMEVLDAFWEVCEIAGVGLCDISLWRWMYAHPDFSTTELKEAAISIAKQVWNQYYADLFGMTDQTILAIYSHQINYPLYLPAYSIGHLITFQLNRYFRDKDVAKEVERCFSMGRLTPDVWMKKATGSPVSVEPMLEAVREVIR